MTVFQFNNSRFRWTVLHAVCCDWVILWWLTRNDVMSKNMAVFNAPYEPVTDSVGGVFFSAHIVFMGLQWIMHCTLFDNCVWLLFCIFTCLFIVCADVPQTVGERKLLSVEGDAVTQPGLRIREVRNVSSNLPQCVKLGGSELLALHSDGDVVIGGFFPLHVASNPQYSYNSKPQTTPCSRWVQRYC